MSRESLVQAYISGLQLTAIAVVADGRRCRITEGEPAPVFLPANTRRIGVDDDRQGRRHRQEAAQLRRSYFASGERNRINLSNPSASMSWRRTSCLAVF